MSRIAKNVLPAIIISLCVGACGSPSMVYRDAKDENPKNQVEGQILFQLRTTNITILAPTTGGADASSVSHTNVCDKKTTPAACLDGVTAKATAAGAKTIYTAVPADTVWFTHTKLAASTVDGDDTLIKTVTVSYNDNTATVIAAAGTGAVSGFALAGPYGAVGGALLSGGAAVITDRAFSLRAENSLTADFLARLPPAPATPQFTDLICKSDMIDAKSVSKPTKLGLTLPVTIGLEDALKVDADNSTCWHLLPEHPPTWSVGKSDKQIGSGWLYRITPGAQPFGAQPAAAYFSSSNDTSKPRHDFPYTACQDATIEIVWWQTAQAGMPDKFERMTYPLSVANPNFLQSAPMPKAGTINLGTVCGAQVAFATYSGGTLQSSIDAAVKDANDIKSAQDTYNKAKQAK